MAATAFTELLGGLAFPESPRWRAGALWFVEKRAGRVRSGPEHGPFETVLEVPAGPGGIDWALDGSLLVVASTTHQLLRWDGVGTDVDVVAELGPYTVGRCNDLVVDAAGRAFVGHFGYDLLAGAPPADATLVRVDPDGEVTVAAEAMAFPNGCVVTPDGTTLIVAESGAARLTAFSIADDGALVDRRVFAELGEVVPDGIALDAEGAIWVADPIGQRVVRILPGGAVTDKVSTAPYGAFACALGGDDGHTLFVCCYSEADSQRADGGATGSLAVTVVDVPAVASSINPTR